MKKILLVGLMCLVGLSIIFSFILISDFKTIDNGGNRVEEDERVFQGPVQEGYDEEHFRRTGETVPLG
jgi:hypothetical protein